MIKGKMNQTQSQNISHMSVESLMVESVTQYKNGT